MNGKKARNLRKLIRTELEHLPERQYHATKVHTREFFSGSTNLDGTPRMIPLELCTVELVACQRVAYKKAKQLHHMYSFGY